MAILALLFIGLIAGGSVFGAFMLLAYLTGLYVPSEPHYQPTFTPAPVEDEVPVEITPELYERRENLRLAILEAHTRELAREWTKLFEQGEINQDRYDYEIDRLISTGLLKSVDQSYRSDRKF